MVTTKRDGRAESHRTWPDPRGFWITLRWDIVNGRVDPVEVTITAPKGRIVTREVLREIPLGKIVDESRVEQIALAERAAKAAKTKQGKRDGHAYAAKLGGGLEVVAATYREAFAAGRSPIEAVAKELGIAESTAAKRVMAARRAGFLGQARPGKGGEA